MASGSGSSTFMFSKGNVGDKKQSFLESGLHGAFTVSKAYHVSSGQESKLQSDRNIPMMVSKSDLADEISLLKESNNKLLKDLVQKERECRELQDRLLLSSKTNSELMDELADLTMENQRYKMKGIAMQEENNTLQNQLSHVRKMYMYSFPKGPVSVWETRLCQLEASVLPFSESSSKGPKFQESWEEVSEKLLKQMQQEMVELENMNQKMSLQNRAQSLDMPLDTPFESAEASKIVPLSIAFSDECELKCAKSLIHHLKSQVEHLKIQTLTQGALLKSALEQLQKFAKASDAAKHSLNVHSSKRFSDPSDELFRAYFTKQLDNKKGASPPGPDDPKQEKGELTEARICPICEAKFPKDVSQSDFENHVFEHLDQENTLLLEQYEMV